MTPAPTRTTVPCVLFTVFLTGALAVAAPAPAVYEIEPTCGPASGHTRVNVTGSGFSTETPAYCLFGALRVQAQVITSTLLQCVSPVAYPQSVEFSVVVGNETELDDEATAAVRPHVASPGLRYLYYTDVIIHSVKPKSAPLRGSTRVRVHGNFAATGSYSCRFASAGSVRVASGVLEDGGGGGASNSNGDGWIACYTPAWDEAEGAELSVSLNRQQYSLSVGFAFKKERYRFKSAQWIVLGCAICGIVAVFGLVIVWVRHRRYIDGYDKIKEGQVDVDLRDIKMEDRIGRGTFGEVYKGTWRGAVVAVKRLNPMQMNEDFVREYEKEVYLMRALRAPNILQFLGSTFNPPDICIVMEYMSRGSLYGILHDPAVALDWPLLLRMLKDTARGMTYLHSCRPPVIHRDLKSHNLLVDEFWKVKVSDFGLSTVFEQVSQTMTACGTPCWTAPEVLRHQRYTVKADVYSFAVVMWECVTRSDVYVGIPPYKIIYAVSNQGLRPKVPSWVPEPYAHLMRRCWDENMDKRPDFASILTEVDEMTHFGWTGRPGPDPSSSSSSSSSSALSPGGNAHKGNDGGGNITATPTATITTPAAVVAAASLSSSSSSSTVATKATATLSGSTNEKVPVNPRFITPSAAVIVSSAVPKRSQQSKPRPALTATATQSVVKKKVISGSSNGGNSNNEKQPLMPTINSQCSSPSFASSSGNSQYPDNYSFFTSSSGSSLFESNTGFISGNNSGLDDDDSDSSSRSTSFHESDDDDDDDDDDDEYY